MLNSQTSILEKLQSLSLPPSIENFIQEIMNFYKNHISRLQKIIIQKQNQIEKIFSLKKNFEKKIENFQIEILQQKIISEKNQEENFFLKKENLNLIEKINFLKQDLQNSIFEKKVKNDDLQNFSIKFEMLEKQNNLLLEKNLILEKKLDFEKFEKKNFLVDEKNESRVLINEIKELKFHLKNENERKFFSPERKKYEFVNKSVFLEKKNFLENSEKKKNLEKNFETDFQKSKNENLENFEDFKKEKKKILEEENKNISPETKEVNISELRNYLTFLSQKEKDIQNNLWKLPSKSRNKVDKQNKRKLEFELDEVNEEIISIKNLIRNNK